MSSLSTIARSALLLAAGLGAGLVPASRAAAQDAPRPMSLVDLIEVPSVRDPRLSPDGDQVVYVRSEADWEENRSVSHVWRAAVDGSDERQLTRGAEGQSSPRWSPDGRWIAFLAGRDEEEQTQIHLLPAAGGEARPLTDHPTSVSDIQWAPDGSSIYFLAPDARPDSVQRRREAGDDVYALDEDFRQEHLWRVDVETEEEVRVTSGDFTIRSYRVSRDGGRVAHHRAPSPLIDDMDESAVWLMDADGSDPLRLTRGDTIPESGARLSPDGGRVLFTAGADEEMSIYYNDNLFVFPADGSGEPRDLTVDFGGDVFDAEWSADGRWIYFRANIGVRVELFRADPDTGERTRLTRGDHQVGSWSYAPDLDRHVFTLETPTSPGDVWTLEAGGASGAEPRRATRVFEDLTDRFRLPRQEAITWEGEDGVEVEGILIYPLDYREGERYPLVVQTHGGPASSDRFEFSSSFDYFPILAARGWMVLHPNYRGSTGYGDAFLREMVPGYFGQAHLDVMAGVDHLIEEGLVDGERMAKMGWSAGGHMTNKIITYTDRFAAASSGAGAANWTSMYAQSDVRIYRTPWFGGSPWTENAPLDVYLEHSPVFDAHRVSTPTLFLVGENDARVPMPQSVEMFRALRDNDVPTHLYVAPREGHGWRELRHRLFKGNVELDWFERWVRDRDYEWEEAPETEDGKEKDRSSADGS